MKVEMSKKSAGILTYVCLLAFANSVYAAPVLVNGGFETGDFTGWTEVSNSGGSDCAADWYVSRKDTQCQQVSEVRLNSAAEGKYAAYNAFDGSAGTSYTIEQDVTLASVDTATLDFSYTVGWDFGLGSRPHHERVFSISFLDAGDSLIAAAYTLGVGPADGIRGFIDWTNISLDVSSILSAYDYQTVTLVVDVFIPEGRTGPGSFGLDDVDLNISAVPLPAAIYLFAGGLLALTGAGARFRRK